MDRVKTRFLSEHLEKERGYWLEKLSGELLTSELPLDFNRPANYAHQEAAIEITLDPETMSRIFNATGRSESLIFTCLVTGLKVCLHKYTGVRDIIVGGTIYNRNEEDAALNRVLVLRDQVIPTATPRQLLEDVKRTLSDAYSNQKYPFERLLEHLQIQPSENRSPLFDVVILLENINNPQNVEHLKNDITVVFSISGDQIKGAIKYKTDLFTRRTVELFAARLDKILRAIMENPDQQIAELDLLSEKEKQEILFSFNNTYSEYPRDKSIQELFEEEALRRGEQVAVEQEGERVSYRELNERANRLAHYLRAQGVGLEIPVGLYLERSVDMIISLLAVLKAGGLYVPLDTDYPQARLDFMLDDTQTPVVLTRERYGERFAGRDIKIISLDEAGAEIGAHSSLNPRNQTSAENLAYVMYTSGSTGVPKGVSVCHRAVVRLVRETNYFELGEEEVFLQMAPLTFDASTFEIWGSLLNGKRLVIMKAGRASLEEIGRTIKEKGVSVLWLTAGLFHVMVEQEMESLRSVRQLLAGGDVLRVEEVKRYLRQAEGRKLINGYGPTENTTFTCCNGMKEAGEVGGSVGIGRAISNTTVYVLDEDMRPVGKGIYGELYIGGEGLARGYWKEPELTAEKFVPNPFGGEGGGRLYKSGDVVRYGEEGVLEFRGRKDNQVKIRGYRIELGEIERAMEEKEEVKEAVVVVKTDEKGEKRLKGYVVRREGRELSVKELREYLKGRVPEYMMVGEVEWKEKMPLTENGKVDRKALREMEDRVEEREEGYEEEKTEIEEIVEGIWRKVLGVERVGKEENFFEKGGHSLLAMQMVTRVKETFGVEIRLREVFEGPTIREMGEVIEREREGGGRRERKEIKRVSREETIPLSFAQQRLWFLNRLMPHGTSYNITTAYKLIGQVNIEALERSINEIIRRHEVLRTRIIVKVGEPVQVIDSDVEIKLDVIDLTSEEQHGCEQELQQLILEEEYRQFDLGKSPLLRANIIKVSQDVNVLLVSLHHIASDGWSMGVFIREMTRLYEGYGRGEEVELEELEIQYADYAVWQREWLRGEELDRQMKYWKEQLDGAPTALDLPTDRPRPKLLTSKGGVKRFTVSKQITEGLRRISQEEGATMYMTLLSAYSVLMMKYTGEKDVVVGTPIANRNREEIEGLIGFFANTLAMRVKVEGEEKFRELVRRVREVALEGYAHQDLPFEKLVEEIQPERDLSRTPVFQIDFIFQNAPKRKLELSELILMPMEVNSQTSKFELSLGIGESKSGLLGAFQYNTDLFDPETIDRLIEHFIILLERVVEDADRPLKQVSVLTPGERDKALFLWNSTHTDYPDQLFLHRLFRQQAEDTPGHMAVAYNDERLTYEQLNERANQLARYLIKRGIGAEDKVAILLPQSPDAVIGALAILKSGGVYVPLDLSYSKEQLDFILADAQVKALLTYELFLDRLAKHEGGVICLDSQAAIISGEDAENCENNVEPENLAGILYAQSRGGEFTGAMITHLDICNTLLWMRGSRPLDKTDRVLQRTPLSAEASVWEILWPLISGATLVIARPGEQSDVDYIAQLIREKKITAACFTPSILQLLVERWRAGDYESFKQVICSGEPLPHELQEQFHGKSKAVLHDFYGVIEAPVVMHSISEQGGDGCRPRPVDNLQVYVLDEDLQPVPVGVKGHIYVAGTGMTRGYVNKPGLTAERLIPNPFGGQGGGRLLKTGDIARYLADGSIQYLSKADRQIKIRGFNVDLSEVESALKTHAAISTAAIVAKDYKGRDKRLVAYLVPDREFAAEVTGELISEAQAYLRERLPDYMIPSSFVMLDNLPLTSDGRLDYKTLSDLERARRESRPVFAPPSTEIEQVIAAMWRDFLSVETLSVNDNFFDVGGHSLLIARLHTKMQERFGNSLTVVDLFRYPTISSLARYISEKQTVFEVEAAKEEAPVEASLPDTAIAIIGMAGRFPGCRNIGEFWEKLKNGEELVSFFSDEELLDSGVYGDLLKDPNYVKAAAVLEDAEYFDAPFFGFSPREAEIENPQHRQFLECSFEALEDAGYDPARYTGRIGVYAGVGLDTYLANISSNSDVMQTVGSFQAVLGNDKDFLPTRVSYKLNLRGPGIAVQTACSTSLVAVHLACQSLLLGDSDMVLCGGVRVKVGKSGYLYQEQGILSPDGHCRAFDAKAGGTVPGNGVGIVVLKRLADALNDGDNIYAVIRGSAVNNDGSLKVGYTAPGVDGQAEVISRAHSAAGVDVETISYVETHGTGTELGDPIEVAALTQAFSKHTDKKGYCALGSVKTNVGHLDAAAGVTGLIKTVLALKHGMLPPSLHFNEANPEIDFASSPFYVSHKLSAWERHGAPRRAGVSSFGIGGTNAHVVLEEAPARTPSREESGPHLLLLSARTGTALEAATANMIAHLKHHGDLDPQEVAYTLQVGRKTFDHRRMVVFDDLNDAITSIETMDPRRVITVNEKPQSRPSLFVFPGQGSQYVNMGIGLYNTQPVFREHVDRCSELLERHLGFDIRRIIYPAEPEAETAAYQLNQTIVSQPAVFVIEYALTKLWMHLGVQPMAMIGHSVGEYVAACVADVISLEDALMLLARRGQLMQGLQPGSMLVVPLAARQVESQLGDKLSIAAINGPELTVVSGPIEAIDDLENKLGEQGLECHRLHTSHAFHSAMMDPAVKQFINLFRHVKLKPPQLPFISNVTGTWITVSQALDPNYWGDHLRRTVCFSDGLYELLKNPRAIILEVGPGTSMTGLIKQHPARTHDQIAIASLRHPKDRHSDSSWLMKTLGTLWLSGVRINWAALYAGRPVHKVPLPTYPFERKPYLIKPAASRAQGALVRVEVQGNGNGRVSMPERLPLTPVVSVTQAAEAQSADSTVTLETRTRAKESNGNGAYQDVTHQIIAQQLSISAQQLQLMSQQLQLLRNGYSDE